jgi:hypothetical protein
VATGLGFGRGLGGGGLALPGLGLALGDGRVGVADGVPVGLDGQPVAAVDGGLEPSGVAAGPAAGQEGFTRAELTPPGLRRVGATEPGWVEPGWVEPGWVEPGWVEPGWAGLSWARLACVELSEDDCPALPVAAPVPETTRVLAPCPVLRVIL